MNGKWFLAKHSLRLLLFLFVLLLPPPIAEGATIYRVTVNGDGNRSGDSWANAMGVTEFRSALQAGTSGEYWLKAETDPYTPTGDTNREASFALKNGVALYSGFAGTETAREQRDISANETILSGVIAGGNNSYNVVTANGVNNTAVLDGFTVTGGNANENSEEHRQRGGGMYIDGSPTVANCTFSGNSAAFSYGAGGGMYIAGGSPTVTNCIFWGPGNQVGRQIPTSGVFTNCVNAVNLNGGASTGNTTGNPNLGPLADNGGPTWTHALLPGSSALAGGATGSNIPATDQRGVPRIVPVDIGAYQDAAVGFVNVTIEPAGARSAGARWKLGEGEWQSSGASVVAATGSATVSFKEAAGWTPPGNRSLTVAKSSPVRITAVYSPATPTPTPTPALPPVPPVTELGPQPVRVELPLGATIEQKRAAVKEALIGLNVPPALAESIAALVNVDMHGYIYLSPGSVEAVERLLQQFDIPEDAVRALLPLFSVAIDGSGGSALAARNIAVAFFPVPEVFFGKRAAAVRAVKLLSAEDARPYVPAFTPEELTDGRSAVVEVEAVSGGVRIKRFLDADDILADGHIVALAIEDGGLFDLDGAVNGRVVDPAFLVEVSLAAPSPTPEPDGGGGGCATSSVSLWPAVLLLPLLLLSGGRREQRKESD